MLHPLTDRAISHLRDLIAFPTVSGTPNLDALHYIAAHFASAGADVSVVPDGDTGRGNLVAHFGAERAGGLMLSGHIDVVPAEASEWSGDPFHAQITDTLVVGRGATDMKGFLACVMALAGHMSRPGNPPVTFVVTDDEERTFSGARNLIAQLADRHIQPRLNIVGEPTLCQVAVAHPGFRDWATTFRGIGGHSGRVDPLGGAIDAAIHFMTQLRNAAQKAGDQAPRINFGRIVGGSARNIVAASCELEWEARIAAPEQAGWLSEWLDTNPALFHANTCVGSAESFLSNVGADLMEICRAITKTDPIKVAYASEAGLYQSAGIPTLVIGPGDIAVAHQRGESLEIAQISRILGILEQLVEIRLSKLSTVDYTARN